MNCLNIDDLTIDLCWTSRKPNLELFEAWSTRKWIWSQPKEITGVDILGLDFWPRRQIRVILVQFPYFLNKYKTSVSYSQLMKSILMHSAELILFF